MIRDIKNSTRHQVNQECSTVYQYLHQRAAIQSPAELIQEFQNLLLQGRNQEQQVSLALEKIILADHQQFYDFLNHCFYLILDCWIATPESMLYLQQLFATLEIISKIKSYDRRRKQLVKLIKGYQQTENYRQLQGLMVIINPFTTNNADENKTVISNETAEGEVNDSNELIGSYLVRYPYLYSYFCAVNQEFERLHGLVARLQHSRQHDYEVLLSQHVIYRVRLKQLAQLKLLAQGAGKAITKVDNPSLLSERAFRIALKQYTAEIDDQHTILEQAQHFVADNKFRLNYKQFKQDLHYFITNGIKPRNNSYQLKSGLKQKLGDIFPQSDAKPLNRTLILQTCRQLLSFLLVEPTASNNQQKFVELIANLGTAQVMMILVKIILICPESKPDLEKKLGAIISHYQLCNVSEALWLIKSLEHLLMAFSIYFGHLDVSVVRSAWKKRNQ